MNKKNLKNLFLILLCALYGCSNFNHKPAVHIFINKMVLKHGFNRQYLTKIFNDATPQRLVIIAMSKPAETKPWYAYRKIFITRSRITDGVKFWQQHAHTLSLAQQKYGVPASIIVAILGVETRYGNAQGNYKVLDSLSTLAFDYPPRSRYFQNELEQFLLLTREQWWKPAAILGSYAGAMGQAQFMPSSYRLYAVDANNKGHSDLISNCDDAILSIAHYLKEKGWYRGQAIALRLEKDNNRKEGDILTLQGHSNPEKWLIYHNFKVITRYNTSYLYAMAVYQLSDKIKKTLRQNERAIPSTTRTPPPPTIEEFSPYWSQLI